MNYAETHTLLELAQSVDNRKFDDMTVASWHAILGHLPYEDCARAVVEHFRASTDYLLPAHVARAVAVIDRERRRCDRERRELEQARRVALEAVPTQDRKAEVIELAKRIPLGDARKLRRPEVLEWERRRQRERMAEPNPHYTGPPPPGGWPVPGEESA